MRFSILERVCSTALVIRSEHAQETAGLRPACHLQRRQIDHPALDVRAKDPSCA